MRNNGKRIFPAFLGALLAATGTVQAAPVFSPPMVRAVTGISIRNTDATEKSGIQIVRARDAMEWARIWEQLMADMAARQRPAGGPPNGADAPRGSGPPAQGPPPQQQFSVHIDNNGGEGTGVWREGIFYTNRDLTGRHDRLAALYMRSQGIDAINAGYTTPLGKRGAALDVTYLTNIGRVVSGANRALGIHGFAWSLGVGLRYPLVADRDRRVEIGLAYDFTRQNTDIDRLPLLGTRAQVLRGQYSRFTPHISFAHYGDSGLFYHRHEAIFGRASTMAHGHQRYVKYRLLAFGEKRFAHGQRLRARLTGQLASARNLASLERFYLGGASSVRGYKHNLISGDYGFAAGLEYRVPLEKSRRVSAFAFLDGGRVYGDSAPAHQTTLLGTGVGLAYDTRDVHATLALGFPLERQVAGERMSATRLHFMLHASF